MVGEILIVFSIAIFVVANIMVLIKAFKKSLLWGFGSLFIPVVTIVFIILNWEETNKYILWFLISIVLFVVGGTIM